ncbi:hypothetical protein RFI_26133 [Reticulomyxa filosa]|uniref:Uncharacterized protein n=1 Tax=Reticulomyxa filosa TaxID=46433 RepID=X6MB52_RETFI|nr:hypothetical protein RFI_26133 [Reticulomyxa filosa]|eukprot:ETO11243.1 hypothetical protein RFI_26133 [Reticulomyxa filosa]
MFVQSFKAMTQMGVGNRSRDEINISKTDMNLAQYSNKNKKQGKDLQNLLKLTHNQYNKQKYQFKVLTKFKISKEQSKFQKLKKKLKQKLKLNTYSLESGSIFACKLGLVLIFCFNQYLQKFRLVVRYIILRNIARSVVLCLFSFKMQLFFQKFISMMKIEIWIRLKKDIDNWMKSIDPIVPRDQVSLDKAVESWTKCIVEAGEATSHGGVIVYEETQEIYSHNSKHLYYSSIGEQRDKFSGKIRFDKACLLAKTFAELPTSKDGMKSL